MHTNVVPRVMIYLRQMENKVEDFRDLLTQNALTWSDLELFAKSNLDSIGILRTLDNAAKAAAGKV